MPEYKFSCPHCKQPIQCDPGYVGAQINCPACGQAIIVPPVPPAAAGAGERTIQIKVSTIRKVAIFGLCMLLAAGSAAIAFYYLENTTTKTISAEWSVLDGKGDQWNLAGGKIHAHGTEGESILASDKQYGDVTYSATLGTANREATLGIRLQDAGNGYLIVFAPAHTPCPWNPNGFVAIIKKVAGNETTLATYRRHALHTTGQAAKIKIIAHGPNIQVLLNGTKILEASDSTYATGRIGLRIYGDPTYPCDATFSHVHFD
jgi:hypothetical protein